MVYYKKKINISLESVISMLIPISKPFEVLKLLNFLKQGNHNTHQPVMLTKFCKSAGYVFQTSPLCKTKIWVISF